MSASSREAADLAALRARLHIVRVRSRDHPSPANERAYEQALAAYRTALYGATEPR